MLAPAEPLPAYPWSSLHWYAAAPAHRPSWIRVDRLLGEHGLREDTAPARAEFLQRIESRRAEETDEESLQSIRRGWCHGSPAFRQHILELIEAQPQESPGQIQRETSTHRAKRIIAEELSRLGWSAEELAMRRKSDPGKLAIAARLRKETTLTLKDIARYLNLGTRKSANANLHRYLKKADRHTQPLFPASTESLGI